MACRRCSSRFVRLAGECVSALTPMRCCRVYSTTPPPPPIDNGRWEDEPSSAVTYLDEHTFVPFLEQKEHALVMFYAPFCGHCRDTKPEFIGAAEDLKDDKRLTFAMVDCPKNPTLCASQNVFRIPAFRYYSHYTTQKFYKSDLTREEFKAFMANRT